MLCHGEGEKMNFLAEKIRGELGLKCFKPANGETVLIPTDMLLEVNCRKSMLEDMEKEYGPVGLTKSVGENITNRRRVVVPQVTGTTDNDAEYRASKRQKVVNAALVIINNEEMCIMSDKQACEEFRVSRHAISLSAEYVFVDAAREAILQALQIALKRYSVVDYEPYIPTTIPNEPNRSTDLFKSFQVEQTDTHFRFKWLASEDDFTDGFFVAFTKLHNKAKQTVVK